MQVTNEFKSKLKTYFIKRLGAYEYRNGWMKLPVCPYCGRENKMGINLSTYRSQPEHESMQLLQMWRTPQTCTNGNGYRESG